MKLSAEVRVNEGMGGWAEERDWRCTLEAKKRPAFAETRHCPFVPSLPKSRPREIRTRVQGLTPIVIWALIDPPKYRANERLPINALATSHGLDIHPNCDGCLV